jgi:hypothetical protein
MYLNEGLSIFSKTTRALIMVTLVGVIPIVYTQTALSQTVFSQALQQKQILTCNLPGHPSCYSKGYAAGLANRGVSCSGFLLNSVGSIAQVANYCSGFSAAQQQQQQQK